MAKAINDAIRRFPNRTPIAEDAFNAFAGSAVTGNATRAKAGVGAMIDLLQARAQAYSKVAQGALPEEDPAFPARPELDAPVMTYLAITGWKDMTPEQKAATGRAMYDQAEELVRLAPLLQRKQAGETAPRLDDLIKELRNMTTSLQVVGKNAAAPDIVTAAQGLNKQATMTPAQPLMMTELENLSKAMTAAKLLAPRPAPPADVTPAVPTATPPVNPRPGAAPAGAATRPAATRPATPGVAPRPATPATRPAVPTPTPAPRTAPAPTPAPVPTPAPAPAPAGGQPNFNK